MESREERRARLRRASKESAAAADIALAEELDPLRQISARDLEALRPKIEDAEAFERLLAAVRASTQANEDKAMFRSRLTQLGQDVVAVAKVVAGVLKG